MKCPEHLVFKGFNGRVYIWMVWRDVPRKTIPLMIWLDLRRYEIRLRAFKSIYIINRVGVKRHKEQDGME